MTLWLSDDFKPDLARDRNRSKVDSKPSAKVETSACIPNLTRH